MTSSLTKSNCLGSLGAGTLMFALVGVIELMIKFSGGRILAKTKKCIRSVENEVYRLRGVAIFPMLSYFY